MCLAARRAAAHFSARLGFLGLGKVPPSSREGRDCKGRENGKKKKKKNRSTLFGVLQLTDTNTTTFLPRAAFNPALNY